MSRDAPVLMSVEDLRVRYPVEGGEDAVPLDGFSLRIREREVASLEGLLGRRITVDEVMPVVEDALARVFGRRLVRDGA